MTTEGRKQNMGTQSTAYDKMQDLVMALVQRGASSTAIQQAITQALAAAATPSQVFVFDDPANNGLPANVFILPVWAKWVRRWAFGAGGGSGSGRRGAAGTNRYGGNGGAGGGLSYAEGPRTELPASNLIVLGHGGIGGAAVLVDDTDGNPGTDGGDTTGLFIIAKGGQGGVGGGGVVAAFSQGGKGTWAGGNGGAGGVGTGGANGLDNTAGERSPRGGGGGGGISAANAIGVGGRGGAFVTAPTLLSGGPGGLAGADGDPGQFLTGADSLGLLTHGASGGGGGGGNRGNGGAGHRWGGGAGGGGASLNGASSGVGRNGGNGLYVVLAEG